MKAAQIQVVSKHLLLFCSESYWHLSDGICITGRPMGFPGRWSLWAGCQHLWPCKAGPRTRRSPWSPASLLPKGTEWTFYFWWYLKLMFSQEYPTPKLLESQALQLLVTHLFPLPWVAICLLAHTLWQHGWNISCTLGPGSTVFKPRSRCCVWIRPPGTLLPSLW